MNKVSRRHFLHASTGAGLAAAVPSIPCGTAIANKAVMGRVKLGIVTYNIGKDMTCPELIALCQAAGLEGVELRTTHAHGVEVTLNQHQRAEVRKLFEDSGVQIAGLGSAFEFHSQDPQEVRRHVEGAEQYAQLAADVRAPGIKLRPNSLHEDEPVAATCERIGKAWREVADFAAGIGVEARMEVHGGRGASHPAIVRKMLNFADHPNALICWNCNPGEEDEHGSIRQSFDLLKHAISLVHINEIGLYQYPWQELFTLLQQHGYAGHCLAEIPYNPQPERFMKYYRTLFDLYTGSYEYPRKEVP